MSNEWVGLSSEDHALKIPSSQALEHSVLNIKEQLVQGLALIKIIHKLSLQDLNISSLQLVSNIKNHTLFFNVVLCKLIWWLLVFVDPNQNDLVYTFVSKLNLHPIHFYLQK